MTKDTDKSLVERTLDGDRPAYEKLVARYAGRVRSLAMARLGSPHDADDAAQEAFVEAYEKLHTLRSRDSFGPWIIAIARTAAGRWSRRKRPREQQLDGSVPDQMSRRNAQAADAHHEDTTDALRTALQTLDKGRREPLMLHYFGELPLANVARLLDLPLGTVKRRLSEARSRLRKELTDMADDKTPKRKSPQKFAGEVCCELEKLEQIKALCHPLRLRIMSLYSDDGLTVGEMAEILDADPSLVRRHVGVLVSAGLAQQTETTRGARRYTCRLLYQSAESTASLARRLSPERRRALQRQYLLASAQAEFDTQARMAELMTRRMIPSTAARASYEPLYLTGSEIEEVAEKVKDLLEELAVKSKEARTDEDAQAYRFDFSLRPTLQSMYAALVSG